MVPSACRILGSASGFTVVCCLLSESPLMQLNPSFTGYPLVGIVLTIRPSSTQKSRLQSIAQKLQVDCTLFIVSSNSLYFVSSRSLIR